jgi:hypothetical protein
MNNLIIIMLVGSLLSSIPACGRQKITQIPQPPQGKQTEALQPTVPAVSSYKWTFTKWALRAGAMTLLWWNWREKVYYRTKSNMQEKFVAAFNTRKRAPEEQMDTENINIAYIDAFNAVNDYIWECGPKECEDAIALRELVCQFMVQDVGLTNATKQHNIDAFARVAVMLYPNRIDRLLKFKQDVGEWIHGIMRRGGALMSRN